MLFVNPIIFYHTHPQICSLLLVVIIKAIQYFQQFIMNKNQVFTFKKINFNNKEVLLQDTFVHNPNYSNQKKLVLQLHADYLIAIEDQFINPKFYELCIDFESSFQIISSQASTKKNLSKSMINPSTKKQLLRPIGIKFFKGNNCTIQFLNENLKIIQNWQIQLSKRMKQRGFHKNFQANKKIGNGNFASVYRALRIKDGKYFAIKAFSKHEFLSQEKGKQSLINQIKIHRLLNNHTNIIKIQGVYETDNNIYIILELVQGEELYSKFYQQNKFNQHQTKNIIKGLLEALVVMAKKNVVHRDLKPQNIMIRNVDSTVVILDFGLATLIDQPEYIYIRCGTPGYVAPEIANMTDLTQKCNSISDVFSAGCIFYQLIFNKPLFPGTNFGKVLLMNQQCNVQFFGQEYDPINNPKIDLLQKMLQKQPSMRITAAQALRHAYFQQKKINQFKPKLSMKRSSLMPEYVNNECLNLKMIVNSTESDFKTIKYIKNLDLQKKVDIKKLMEQIKCKDR